MGTKKKKQGRKKLVVQGIFSEQVPLRLGNSDDFSIFSAKYYNSEVFNVAQLF